MSSTLALVTVLLSSALVIALVLQPPGVEPAAVRPRRCQGESWQSIRKGLLEALGLQDEPRLPGGGLDGVREQWQRMFGTIAHRVKNTARPEVPDAALSPDSGNATSLNCCSVTTEVSMKDLGWDRWVVQPLSLTIVQCAPCSGDAAQCPSPQAGGPDDNSQERPPCCQPTSYEMVPVLYLDDFGTVVISSVQLPRGCGCGAE